MTAVAQPGALPGMLSFPAADAVTLPPAPSFGEVVAARRARGELVVQPRMGFADPVRMRL